MKAFLMISPLIFFGHGCLAAPVSVEDFSKIASGVERIKLIEQAPPEQREKLEAINMHLNLLSAHGGEEGLKKAKMDLLVDKRGLGGFSNAFWMQMQAWGVFYTDTIEASRKAGMTPGATRRAGKVVQGGGSHPSKTLC